MTDPRWHTVDGGHKGGGTHPLDDFSVIGHRRPILLPILLPITLWVWPIDRATG